MSKPTNAEINILAYAASFGEVTIEDFYQSPKHTAQVSKSQRLAWKKFNERATNLVNYGLLSPGLYRYHPTPEGIAFLLEMGFVQNKVGFYLMPGARIPKWAF